MHSDAEEVLLESGSRQADLWGANYYPGRGREACIEFTSFINIRPSAGNRGMELQDEALRARVRELTLRPGGRRRAAVSMAQHAGLSAERFARFSRAQQLLAIANEMNRASKLFLPEDQGRLRSAYERVLALADLRSKSTPAVRYVVSCFAGGISSRSSMCLRLPIRRPMPVPSALCCSSIPRHGASSPMSPEPRNRQRGSRTAGCAASGLYSSLTSRSLTRVRGRRRLGFKAAGGRMRTTAHRTRTQLRALRCPSSRAVESGRLRRGRDDRPHHRARLRLLRDRRPEPAPVARARLLELPGLLRERRRPAALRGRPRAGPFHPTCRPPRSTATAKRSAIVGARAGTARRASSAARPSRAAAASSARAPDCASASRAACRSSPRGACCTRPTRSRS